MKYKIKDVKEKPFTGENGEKIPYFWYKAERISDGVTLTFGSKNGNLDIGSETDLDIEKREKTGGGFTYIDVTETE